MRLYSYIIMRIWQATKSINVSFIRKERTSSVCLTSYHLIRFFDYDAYKNLFP
jgi:hypothetical protein